MIRLSPALLAAALALGTLFAEAPAQAATAASAAPSSAPPKVLLVVSAEGRLDAAGKPLRPGFEMEEFAQAWLVFKANGLQLEVASPSGGAVVADRHDPKDDLVQAIKADAEATAALAATRRTQDVRAGEHAAIFVVGGKGAMFDLPVDLDLKHLLARTYDAGGVIGAVCHGPAALINVPMPKGGTLVAGKSVTGFSNEEEALFGKRWAAAFPVLLEDGLRGAGARFSEAPMMLDHVVTDGRLVTGQNPYSTSSAADAVVRAMGRVPVAREPFADERSIALIARVHTSDGERARADLAASLSGHDLPLIAAGGH